MGGSEALQFSDRHLQIYDSIISHNVSRFSFSYCMCNKIIWNLLVRRISLHKELYYIMHPDTTLLFSSQVFWFCGSKVSSCRWFSKKIFKEEEKFLQAKIGGGAAVLCAPPPAKTPLLSFSIFYSSRATFVAKDWKEECIRSV